MYVYVQIDSKFKTFIGITVQEHSFTEKNKNNTKHTCINDIHKTIV